MPTDLGFHWGMLNDYDRNTAYRTAIEQAAPGRIVYDLGAGVGPMSFYALAAGARRVYGFELDRDAHPYLRRLARQFRNFVTVRGDVLKAPLPQDAPDVVVCEMWSSWLTHWPMVKALERMRRRAPASVVIPLRAHHFVQLVQTRNRAAMPVRFAAGAEAVIFGEPYATAEMSVPALACVTDFRSPIISLDAVLRVVPLTTGVVDAVRFYSLEEVAEGHILPRIGTRGDELLRWINPVGVRRGRRITIRIRHRWDAGLVVRVD